MAAKRTAAAFGGGSGSLENRGGNGGSSGHRCCKYGVMSMIQDLLLVCIFASLLVMNQLNLSVLHLANYNYTSNDVPQQQHQQQPRLLPEQQLQQHRQDPAATAISRDGTTSGVRDNSGKTVHSRPRSQQKLRSELEKDDHRPERKEGVRQSKIPTSAQRREPSFKRKEGVRQKKLLTSARRREPPSDRKEGVRQKKIPTSAQQKETPSTMGRTPITAGIDNDTSLESTAVAGDRHRDGDDDSNNAAPIDGVVVVELSDRIYRGTKNYKHKFDVSPIVVEEHKLVFFGTPKVACTTFKFLFRKMAGYEDWDVQETSSLLPHNPASNGLRYLWSYAPEEATRMMNDPTWTRAIFVRDPKTRFLSAFLDKAVSNYGSFFAQQCCPAAVSCHRRRGGDERRKLVGAIRSCRVADGRGGAATTASRCCEEFRACQEPTATIEGFLTAIGSCPNPHWDPQSHRMDDKYWKQINFVGSMENIRADAEALLRRIGAWEAHGATGWGPDRDKPMIDASGSGQSHTTGSSDKIEQWYTPRIERLVEEFYEEDYANPVLGDFYARGTNLTKPPEDGTWLKHDDPVYRSRDWDGAPVVVERYKLIFFTIPNVGATEWKQAFRRMEGHPDWKDLWGPKGLPHDPRHNGLRYLYDYPVREAEAMMTSPEWTRAMFVRYPKDRFLSVYWQMKGRPNEVERTCCPNDAGCSSATKDVVRFLRLTETCWSAQWAPYAERFGGSDPELWWKRVDFIGKLETADRDAEALLRRIGAWDAIGQSGWGPSGDESIFREDPDDAFRDVHNGLGTYTPAADKLLSERYAADYANPYLNFTSRKVYIMEDHHPRHRTAAEG